MSQKGLYVKGMDVSGSDEEEEDVWDDSKLRVAYDKAMKVAGLEVAKRVAMATNKQPEDKKGSGKKKKSKSERKILLGEPSTSQWKVGAPCRAVYEEDGFEYEALIVKILSDDRCIVQFLGYNNREEVKTSSLKNTRGKDARTIQIDMAAAEQEEENLGATSDGTNSPVRTERSSQSNKNVSKKKMNNFKLPEIPMPNFNMMGNLGGVEMPMPPPLSMPALVVDSEHQAMSSMMLSWYMSGYYTGLYQGIKRAKEKRRSRNT